MSNAKEKTKKTFRGGFEILKKGVSAISEKAPGIAAVVAGKTKELVNVGQLKLQVQVMNNKLEKVYNNLGKKVHSLVTGKTLQIEKNESVKKFISDVNKLKREIKTIEKKIDAVKKETKRKIQTKIEEIKKK